MTKRYRKDGRELVTESPVKPEEFIEIYTGPIPEDVIRCRMSRDREYEAWMDDI